MWQDRGKWFQTKRGKSYVEHKEEVLCFKVLVRLWHRLPREMVGALPKVTLGGL